MLCRRSASLTSSTRTSSAMASNSLRRFSACLASLVTRSSLFSLVRPSTSAPMSWPNRLIDLGAGRLGILDRVVQQRGGDGGVVELEVGENRRDFDRMGEIRIAGGAPLLAMRLHGVDIGAVEQVLVGVRIVSAHPLDQVVLPHHLRRLLGLSRLLSELAAKASTGAASGARDGTGFASAADRCARAASTSLKHLARNRRLRLRRTLRYHDISLWSQWVSMAAMADRVNDKGPARGRACHKAKSDWP